MSASRREWLKAVAAFAAGAIVGSGASYLALQSVKTAVEKTATTRPAEATTAPSTAAGLPKMKIHFIYVGPIGDYGWTHAHDVGRKYLESALCPDPKKWCIVETSYTEKVPEGEAYDYIKRAVADGANMVITTSYGYMDATKKAARDYPDRFFAHCSGEFKSQDERASLPNFAEYFIDLYEAYYLNGIVAGRMTKTNKLGYVAAFLIPEVIRHMNAFLLGAREVNPKVTMDVVQLGEWYSPERAKKAAVALVESNGADVLAFTEDSPTVLQTAEEYQRRGKAVWSFSHYSDMSNYGPKAHLTGQVVNWGPMYVEMAIRAYLAWVSGETALWSEWPPERPRDYWWSMKNSYRYYDYKKNPTDIILPLNPAVPEEVKAYVEKRRAEVIEGVWDPFTGPIKDMKGVLRVADRMRLSKDDLYNMDWFVEGYGQLPT
ncbi:BMP family ABC transporter substrate-binding protein [Pyrobaculum neutrophilum]|uniref:Basic membrane lipoprotein n=1 Tax=Pyrobaculum neutrophilum (strain DSM 2338 / JCM 9278 / NBRC 100436 / V24Sta) TaxID=444157 RepID=B1Y912_PYRNV|nr:BMP family ABC transporter substrate-binding protein [Pyrobaculum neutrophilum]ACB40241.1 basic membrane lipoprotein [Pyrobaculum neutrophilum V24Sta]